MDSYNSSSEYTNSAATAAVGATQRPPMNSEVIRRKVELEKGLMNINLLDYKFQEAILGQTDVSLTLARKLISTEAKDKNLVLSPLPMNILLGLIKEQLVPKLLTDGGPRWSSDDKGVWVDVSLPVDNTSNDPVDFLQAKHHEVSLNDLTRLVLAKALYFKGTWNESFNASMTKNDKFFLSNGTDDSVQVPFMRSYKEQYISAFDGFKVLGLKYKQQEGEEDKRKFSMYLYLPDDKDGLPSLIEKVNSGFIQDHLPHQKVEVGDFRIPRFKFHFGFKGSDHTLKEELLDLALCIEINEQGTQALANSGVVIGVRGMRMSKPRRKVDFVANHPFLFVIREDSTGVLFFVGQLVNPFIDHYY